MLSRINSFSRLIFYWLLFESHHITMNQRGVVSGNKMIETGGFCPIMIQRSLDYARAIMSYEYANLISPKGEVF